MSTTDRVRQAASKRLIDHLIESEEGLSVLSDVVEAQAWGSLCECPLCQAIREAVQ